MNWQNVAIEYLKKTPLGHHHFIEAIETIEALLLTANPGEMIIVSGPTRVGKTFLAQELANRIYGTLNQGEEDVPYAMVTAANSSTAGSFSTRSLTKKALLAVRHPMYSDAAFDKLSRRFSASQSRVSEGDMRDDLISALQERHTDTLFIDELQNIRFVKGGYDSAAWFFDSLKCVAAEAHIKMVITATYELLPIRDRCSQLVGRSDTVHFPRYKCETVEETCQWEQALEAYSGCLRFKGNSHSLRDWSERLHELTFGCFGLLNKLLRSTIAYSKLAGAHYIELQHIERSRKDPRERDAVWQSIRFGEQYLADSAAMQSYDDYVWDEKQNLFIGKAVKQRKKKKAFQRLPHRYGPDERIEGQL